MSKRDVERFLRKRLNALLRPHLVSVFAREAVESYSDVYSERHGCPPPQENVQILWEELVRTGSIADKADKTISELVTKILEDLGYRPPWRKICVHSAIALAVLYYLGRFLFFSVSILWGHSIEEPFTSVHHVIACGIAFILYGFATVFDLMKERERYRE